MRAIKTGDLIGFSGTDWVSDVINVATFGVPRWGIHHVGIVGHYNENEPLLYESIGSDDGRPPCCRLGRPVCGCQAHPLEQILELVDDQMIWHYPLRCELYPHEHERLLTYLESTLGRPYDMLGAVRSGGWMFSAVNRVLHPEDLASFFCSEWSAASLVDIGRLVTRNVGKWNPNRLLRYLLREGVCDQPNLLRAPSSLLSSSKV